jgi:hypothetical protein
VQIGIRADVSDMFKQCRYCGAELSHARQPLERCANCEDSPLCDRCGQPRSFAEPDPDPLETPLR